MSPIVGKIAQNNPDDTVNFYLQVFPLGSSLMPKKSKMKDYNNIYCCTSSWTMISLLHC
jgi:hypothetical protein